MRSTQFTIQAWSWEPDGGVLTCKYTTSHAEFAEVFRFGFSQDLDETLARAFDLLAVTAGVSYFKTSFADSILLPVDPTLEWTRYVADLYDRGMREFRFQNSLPLDWTPQVGFTGGRTGLSHRPREPQGALVTMGGGRDSLLVAHAFRSESPALMAVGHNPIVRVQAEQLGLQLHNVERRIDPVLFDLNRQGAPNGHVPVTGINSCIAVALGVLLDRSDVVLANERSASSPTRVVDGIAVNHQYSKSWEYENRLRAIIDSLDLPLGYFSALRSLGEIEISEKLARNWDQLPPFVSCNRARTLDKTDQFPTWCTRCAKCYFVYLALAPFVPRHVLSSYFGRDLLGTPEDVDAIDHLLLGDSRDFECIGTPAETAYALNAATAGDWNDVDALRTIASRNQVDSLAVSAPLGAADATPEPYRSLIGAL